MADEATSADPEALREYVDTGARVRGGLTPRVGELDGLVRWVESGGTDFGVAGMGALVERLTALGVQWERTEAEVAAVREALLGADAGDGGFPTVDGGTAEAFVGVVDAGVADAGVVDAGVADAGVVDAGVVEDLAASLVRGGLTEALAAEIAAATLRLVEADPSLTVFRALRRASAEATGVSEDELDRRGRAFGLGRAEVAAAVADHWDAAERASGGHGVTLAGLRAVADDERASTPLRDAAYRLASDPGLFNDLDSSAQTRGVTATGYDWSQVDGVIGRADLHGFAERDAQIRAVLPWRLLIDSASDGFQLGRADGVIRARDVERFVHDRRIPAVVRWAAWELYAATDPDLVRDVDPFRPDDSEHSDNEPNDHGLLRGAAGGWLLTAPATGRSSWLASGGSPPPRGSLTAPDAGPLTQPPPGTAAGGAGFAGLVAALAATVLDPVVDAGVDQATAAWDRARSAGMPGTIVVFDPRTGQPVALDTQDLAGLAGDDAVAAVFWAAATGRPVDTTTTALPSIPDGAWLDPTGRWHHPDTNRPLAGGPPWPGVERRVGEPRV